MSVENLLTLLILAIGVLGIVIVRLEYKVIEMQAYLTTLIIGLLGEDPNQESQES